MPRCAPGRGSRRAARPRPRRGAACSWRPLVLDVEHVGAAAGQHREQPGQLAGTVRERRRAATGSGRPRRGRGGSPCRAAAGRRCRPTARPRPAARNDVGVVQHRGDAGRARRLDDQLGPLQAQQQGARQRRPPRRSRRGRPGLRTWRERVLARRRDGDAVGHRRHPLSATGWPADRRAGKAAAPAAWAATTSTSGRSPLTAAATPATSPPPPVQTTTVRTSGHCSSTSRPTVPWPAMTSGWSNGWMSTAPVTSACGVRRGQRLGERRAVQPHVARRTPPSPAPWAAARTRA